MASKKLQIWRLPPVLVCYNFNYLTFGKLRPVKKVRFASFLGRILVRDFLYSPILPENFYYVLFQIVHLKRFHFLNGRWIKSHKIVDFPVKDFDPTDYLAAVPCNTLQRYKELVEMGKTSSAKVTKARNVWKNCNGIIDEHTEIDMNEEIVDDETYAQFSDKIINDLQQNHNETETSPKSCETRLLNGKITQHSEKNPIEELITNSTATPVTPELSRI